MEKPSLSLEDFRARFPEIDAEQYPDAAVEVRLLLADRFFSPKLWPDAVVRNHVMGLYAAHFLAASGSKAAGGGGGAAFNGLISSKSADGVSVSYDTASTQQQGAGFWNATAYGRELYQLMRVFGAGAVQL